MKTYNTTEEGIYRIIKGKDDNDYADITVIQTKGIVRDIRFGKFSVESFAFAGANTREFEGHRLELESKKGRGFVDFPKKLSDEEVRELMNHRINYEKRTWHSKMEGMSTKYEIELASGPLDGKILRTETSA